MGEEILKLRYIAQFDIMKGQQFLEENQTLDCIARIDILETNNRFSRRILEI